MKRLYLQWLLTSDERYHATLKREGWTDAELTALRLSCQSRRVQLALCAPIDRADVITVTASLVALVAMVLICH